jgi:diguanylate cyclase (GGDEF)-like protein
MVNGPPTVGDLMSAPPISVVGSETVDTVIELISKHDSKSLPVVEHGRLIGLVTPIHLLGQPHYRRVSEVMAREVVPATPDLSLAEAEALLTRQRLEVLPVTRDGLLIGVISLVTVLTTTNTQMDPLTGLPWSTALRTWTGTALKRGHEVAIIFVDLDDFGLVNRGLGYVAGDALLRAIAHLLTSLVESSTDILCRYGGDEFALATTRNDAEVKALAHRIHEIVGLSLKLRGARHRLTASLGLAGSRHDEGRAALPIAATVENLLAVARRAAAQTSMRRRVIHYAAGSKGAQPLTSPPQNSRGVRLRLIRATIREEASESTASVELRLGARGAVGTASGHACGKGLLFLLAEATLRAVPQLIGQEHAFILEDLVEIRSDDERLVVVVLIDGRTRSERFVGTAHATDTKNMAPQAVLGALNRRLAGIAAEVLRRDFPAGGRTIWL